MPHPPPAVDTTRSRHPSPRPQTPTIAPRRLVRGAVPSVLLGALLSAPVAVRSQAAPDTMPRVRQDSTRARADSARRAASVAPVRVTESRTVVAVGGASAVTVRPDSLPLPPAPSLEQVLRDVPFVLVRQNSRGEAELSIRGSESRQLAVVVDGIPLTLGWDHRTDPSLLPLTGARSVTLVRGLSSLLHGPNVLGGVIEVDLGSSGTPAPTLQLGTSVDQFAGRVVSASGGVPRIGARGVLSVRGGATWREREGVGLSDAIAAGDAGVRDPGRPGQDGLRSNSDLRQLDAYTTVRYETLAGAHVGLTATAYQARRGVPPELHLSEPRFWRYPDLARTLTLLSAGTGALASRAGQTRLTASVGLATGRSEIETFESQAYVRVTGHERGDERTITGRVVGSHRLPDGLELRAAYTANEVRYDEQIDPTPASRYRQRLSSGAVEAERLLFSRVLASGGLALDAASTPETGGKPALGRLTRPGWRLGATSFARDGALRLHVSASQRARFPALRELYSGSLDRFELNPDLRPERLLGVEAGAMLSGAATGDAGLTLHAVGFRHRLDDAVVRVSAPGRRFRRVNRDELRSTGLELLASWRPPGARPGTPLGELSISGDLLVQRVRAYDRTLAAGLPSERRPEHQPAVRGSGEVEFPLPVGVRGLGMVRVTGRQFCVNPDVGRQVELEPQTMVNAVVLRDWTLVRAAPDGRRRGLLRTLRAQLGLDNVADAAVFDQCGLPQPGRTLRLGLELR